MHLAKETAIIPTSALSKCIWIEIQAVTLKLITRYFDPSFTYRFIRIDRGRLLGGYLGFLEFLGMGGEISSSKVVLVLVPRERRIIKVLKVIKG